ncbi:Acid phosphatase [Aphelenchoides fujianensis]|nr:Acid phosphatase [Aphelenchoides fujianensis]
MIWRPLAILLLAVSAAFGRRRLELLQRATDIRADGEDKLLLVQTVWRHGDRSPIYTFKNDKVKESQWTKGGGGYGQLSPHGMEQHLRLGQELRKRYKDFIDARYRSNEIYVRSTDVNRTIISAISNLAGFYTAGVPDEDYPKNLQGWPGAFVPVPIHTVDHNDDYVTGCSYESKRGVEVFGKLRRAPDYMNVPLTDKLNVVTGDESSSTLWNVYNVFDTLFIEKIYKFNWPDGMTDELYKETQDLADLIDDIELGMNISDAEGVHFETEVPKTAGGPLLAALIGHMQAKRTCFEKKPEDRTAEEAKLCSFYDPLKYYVYSAHDSTLGALFSTFGFKYTDVNATGLPHYAACVALELYSRSNGASNEYTVKLIFWQDGIDAWDITQDIAGCERNCTLDKFAGGGGGSTGMQSDFPSGWRCMLFCNNVPSAASSTPAGLAALLVSLLVHVFLK